MTATPPVLLEGSLASHARGRTLAVSFGAVTESELPPAGCALVLGKDFQGDDALAQRLVAWAVSPGRLLVVLPPFARDACDVPVGWEPRRTESVAGGETALGRLLAGERRHEIRGRLVPFEKTGGSVVTAGWRKHPAAGLVVITALPIWSLTALDHTAECREWLTELYGQAGTAPTVQEEEQTAESDAAGYAPTADEWTLLLHLCTGPYANDAAAFDALARSAVHRLAPDAATSAHISLSAAGLVDGGSLTQAGDHALLDGPYAPYARALRRSR
jgi:hypothetical protein